MTKETYYFSHDSNALTDTKILNMRADYGLEGYGLYWAIIEMLRNETTYKLELSKNTYRAIKTLANPQNIDIEKFINECIEDYKLFVKEGNMFFSKSLLNRMQEYEKKKKINKENGKLGGRPRKEKTEEKPNGYEKESEEEPIDYETKTENNQSKGKESKGKENKVKESKIKESKVNKKEKEDKRKEIVEIYNASCTNLPAVQKVTDKRNKQIDEFIKNFTIEQFKEICCIANNSDFLTGKNDRGWKADFDFVLRIDKATKILEGKYNNAKPSSMSSIQELWNELGGET